MKYNQLLSTFLLLLLSIGFLKSQPARPATSPPSDNGPLGTITGTIQDNYKMPLPYSTVYVLKPTDSTVVTGGYANDKGFILIKDVPFGTYILEIYAMGFRKHYSVPFTLSQKNSVYNFKKYTMTERATQMGEVEVTAQREMLQQNLDKTVYNVENNVIADGATAVEVLAEIPSVDVDLEGNVSLRGSENVRILVDGRPSNLTLDQIPASQIQSIEVITNPSARFEPDGMSGILNVILKKNREQGFNGMVSVGSALNLFQNEVLLENANTNLNLNYHVGKINFFFNYSFGRYGWHRASQMDKTTWFGTDSTFMYNEDRFDMLNSRHNLKTALDYKINSQNMLSFGFGAFQHQFGSTNTNRYENSDLILGELFPINEYVQNGEGKRKGRNFESNISYKFTSEKKKGREFFADLFYTQMGGSNYNDFLQHYLFPTEKLDYYQLTRTLNNNKTGTAQFDFITPIGNGGRLETGYKFSYRSLQQDYSLFYGTNASDTIEDMLQRNDFEYREYIQAGYLIYSNSIAEKFKYQLGLRAEYADTYSDLKSTDTVYRKPYFNLFPTIHLKYEFSRANQIQLSYSRRVTRPGFWHLNPFVDVSDKQNIRKGNPNLGPEFADNIELGYTTVIKNSSLTFTAFYRIRTDLITRYTESLQAAIEDGFIIYDLMDGNYFTTPVVAGYDSLEFFPYTLTSTQNINSSENIGLELVYAQKLFDFWRFNLSTNFYRVIIKSEDLIDPNLSNDWAYGIRLNQTIKLPKDWDVQLNFRFRSKSITTGSMGFHGGVGQGRRSASYHLNLGVKKGFLDNNLTVSLNIRDLIYNPKTYIHTFAYKEFNGYDANSVRWRSSFQVNLTVSYKFNNYKERRERGRDVDSMEQPMMD